jgi:soluble lytic murein transglycosylase
MQVMPAVGKSIAPSAGITSWDPALLYDPGVNIEIGIRHLAPLLKRQPNVARSLAAYNAGGSRVARWATKRGADDPEIFTERIPFSETRDYVKSVLRNREFYQVLYAW